MTPPERKALQKVAMTPIEVKMLRKIVDYLWSHEQTNCDEAEAVGDDTSHHIFRALEVIKGYEERYEMSDVADDVFSGARGR